MDYAIEYFKFEEQPHIIPRTPLKGMSKRELKSIKKYPYIIVKNCNFEFKVVYGEESLKLKGTIPKGFCYNQADIPFILQPIAFDKHSPFVKDASLIHDYLLWAKVFYYNYWDLANKGFTVADFRRMTSKIFELALIRASVNEDKASLMAKVVDIFQAFKFIEWGKCECPSYVPDKTIRMGKV